MKTSRGKFFERFALFLKGEADAMLIGFGTDEMYYVVATWDENGVDLYRPTQDLYDRPVL